MSAKLNSLRSKHFSKPIECPFNMEALLRADPVLLKLWNARPFTFDLDEHGKILVRYIRVVNDSP